MLLSFLLILSESSRTAEAVVGQAEEYDPFKAGQLEEFHQDLLGEEQRRQMEQADAFLAGDDTHAKTPPSAGEEGGAAVETDLAVVQDVEKLKREILKIPPRDRFKFGLDGQHTFDSNIQRARPREEKSDHIFDTNGFVEFDAGGRKTDLRLEARLGKQWNLQFPESDFFLAEERIRYRRKYFKKITHSVQSRIARQSQRTVELNEKKVRWDSHQNTIFNYAFSRKLSINTEFNTVKRLYTTEPFDQDSQWEASVAPSAFWSLTPKSRLSLGFIVGPSSIRTKVGNSNTYEVHGGYFGQVTRKSSLSFDFSFSHQTPKSLETPEINTLKLGTGYIWQFTPKSQIIFQAIRSVQNTSSDSVEGGDENATTKGDSHFTNDSLTVSVNSRLNRKLTTIVNLGISHFRNETAEGGDESTEGRQFSFPVSFTANYMLKRWMQLRVRYTYAFRTGNEKPDTYRAHSLTSGVNLVF